MTKITGQMVGKASLSLIVYKLRGVMQISKAAGHSLVRISEGDPFYLYSKSLKIKMEIPRLSCALTW